MVVAEYHSRSVLLIIMSEADWWLCSHCQSLNNLSARKCYSCRRRKPKDSVRASEYLGYVPVVDQNGKVALADIPPPAAGPQLGPAASGMPPLRDPIPRDTLAVAPRPPHGARITYRPLMPPPQPPADTSPLPAQQPGEPRPLPPMPAGPPAITGPTPLVAMGPGPRPAHPSPAPPAQRVAVPVIPIPGQTEPWAHWGDLLDVPKPAADRLRAAYSHDHAAATPNNDVSARHSSAALTQAMKSADLNDPDRARTFVPWPASDRPANDQPPNDRQTPPATPTKDEP